MAQIVATLVAVYICLGGIVRVRVVAGRWLMAVVRGVVRVLSAATLRRGSVLVEVDRDGAIWIVAKPPLTGSADSMR